ncbi:hypothetical protein Lal_00031196 [Lupinus albus]|nr:hypothetical protein Lal_00031196 [Lupinus albus]
MLHRLRDAAVAEKFMQRKNGVVAGVIGIMTGRPISHVAIIIADREIVGNRDRFIVGDQKAILRPLSRTPCPHSCIGAGLVEIDRRLAALLLFFCVFRHPVFMGAPAEFGGLKTLGDKTFHRPGVPESAKGLGVFCPLRVAFSHMHALDAELLHELCPGFAVMRLRLFDIKAGIFGEIDQRLLHEPRHHAGVRPAGGNGRRAAGLACLFLQHGLAKRIIGSGCIVGIGVEIKARPWLNHRVDIEHAVFAAEPHQIDGSGIDRKIDAEALALNALEQRLQNFLVILLGQMCADVVNIPLGQKRGDIFARIDDDEPGLVEIEMTFDQRKSTAPDGAEADHDDGAVNIAVNRMVCVRHSCWGALVNDDKEFSPSQENCLLDSFIERVAALQGATPVLIALYDSEDRLRHANPSFQESFQITPEEFPTWADIMRLNHRLQTGVVVRHRDFEGWLLSAQSRRGKLPYRAFEMDMYDGRWFWMTETVQQDGWMLCIASDVTELRQGYRALRQDRDLAVRASQTDELTGTANRRFVFAKLALQVERVGKGLEAPFCLCTLDIDFFKQINDRFGHKCGDAVLRDFHRGGGPGNRRAAAAEGAAFKTSGRVSRFFLQLLGRHDDLSDGGKRR